VSQANSVTAGEPSCRSYPCAIRRRHPRGTIPLAENPEALFITTRGLNVDRTLPTGHTNPGLIKRAIATVILWLSFEHRGPLLIDASKRNLPSANIWCQWCQFGKAAWFGRAGIFPSLPYGAMVHAAPRSRRYCCRKRWRSPSNFGLRTLAPLDEADHSRDVSSRRPSHCVARSNIDMWLEEEDAARITARIRVPGWPCAADGQRHTHHPHSSPRRLRSAFLPNFRGNGGVERVRGDDGQGCGSGKIPIPTSL